MCIGCETAVAGLSTAVRCTPCWPNVERLGGCTEVVNGHGVV